MVKVIRFLLFYIIIYPVLKVINHKTSRGGAWVIGGHAGKVYADNSAALHEYIINETKQPVVWITKNHDVERELQKRNAIVYRKDSIKARLAILNAPVLIRSHGNSDIDSFFGQYVKSSALVIHLNHCMNHIKAGQMYNPRVEKMSDSQKRKVEKKIFDFDYLLASSPLEQRNFQLSIPSKAEKIILGGGAHLDSLMKNVVNTSDQKTILYFPTWREKTVKSKKSLFEVISEIVNNPGLDAWLKDNNYKFVVCMHINLKNKLNFNIKSERINIIPTTGLQKAIKSCSLFISDYSGVIVDMLYLGKPVLFYPYDINEYLQSRYLYVNYDEFAFGPVVYSTDKLLEYIKNQDWVNMPEYINKRKSLYKELFPYGNKKYAERSYQAICHLLEGKDPGEVM